MHKEVNLTEVCFLTNNLIIQPLIIAYHKEKQQFVEKLFLISFDYCPLAYYQYVVNESSDDGGIKEVDESLEDEVLSFEKSKEDMVLSTTASFLLENFFLAVINSPSASFSFWLDSSRSRTYYYKRFNVTLFGCPLNYTTLLLSIVLRCQIFHSLL